MQDILTITLNPAVDTATAVERITPDVKMRCEEPLHDPGGGGINVARAIQMLGGHATALIAIGGPTGAALLEMLAFEGVRTVAFQGPGETRRSFSVTDRSTGEQFRFVTPGPSWSEADVERALTSIEQATDAGTLVVLSGSQPPGVAREFPSILSSHVTEHGARLIVDTSGPALRDLVGRTNAAVYVLRMDDAEAQELAGKPLHGRDDTAAFASKLVSRGVARNVIVARGADGSVLSNGTGAWHAACTGVKVVSKIGAGDSFVGAFTLWCARGAPIEEALKAGVAAASAAVASEATRLCDRELTERLLGDCTLTPL